MEQSCYKMYIEQISKYPLLTAEQEHELSKKIKAGDERAKNALINSNLRLVVSIAVKDSRSQVPLMDTIQEGNLGLLVAASKYDNTFKTRFSTYAYAWIVQYINRYANLKESIISLPALKLEKLRTIRTGTAELSHKLCRIPSIQEVSIYVGLDENIVRELKMYDYRTISIDSKINDESSKTFVDFLCDENANPELEIMHHFEQQEYIDIINELPSREREVMISRYRSFITGEKVSLHRIGKKLGLSVEATRQIEIRARIKLRPALEAYAAQFA